MASFDPDNKKQVKLLVDHVNWSRRMLRPHREHAIAATQQYAGKHFGHQKTDRLPMNMMEYGVSTYLRQIISSNPSALVIPEHPELRRSADLLELGINHTCREINLEDTLNLCALNSMFFAGVVKCGTAPITQIEVGGEFHDVGQPYVDSIGWDDWFEDMRADTWEQQLYRGHDYRIPRDQALDIDLYDKKVIEDAEVKERINRDGEDNVGVMRSGEDDRVDQTWRPLITLTDIYLPDQQMIVTVDRERGMVARVVEYEGPEGGPFIKLGFMDVPGSAMPLPPSALFMDGHDLIARLWRKMGRQAERQKTITGVRSGAKADGDRVLRASDGQTIHMHDPNAVREFSYGGVNAETMGFALNLRQNFSSMNGNLDLLAGAGPQSETARQDQLLAGNASVRVSRMQDRMIGFVSKIMEHVGDLLWYDPLIDLPLTRQVPGTSLQIQDRFDDEAKEGDFLDYNVRVEPYSLRRTAPEERLQHIRQVVDRIIQLGQLGYLEAQEVQLDIREYLRLETKYTNTPEVDGLVTIAGRNPQTRPGPVHPSTGVRPQSTEHTSVRVSRPGATNQGNENTMMRTLLGGGANQDEIDALGRQAG